MDPTVTIAIPVYNAARYIEDAVRSAMRQSFVDVEILVVDNASSDNTVALVQRTAGRDDRVRVVRNPANVGMTGNFNRCLELARGRFVKFLCADDALEPRCVEEMMGILNRQAAVALVGCSRHLIDVSGTRRGMSAFAASDVIVPGPEIMNRCFFGHNGIGEPTAVMFRRALAQRGFLPEYNQAIDLEMWLHLLEQGDFAFLAQPLCSIRQHDDQQTVRNVRSGRMVEDKQRLFRAFRTRSWLRPTLARMLSWDLRMASSVAKSGEAGAKLLDGLSEVYFPRLFKTLLLPLVRLARGLRGS